MPGRARGSQKRDRPPPGQELEEELPQPHGPLQLAVAQPEIGEPVHVVGHLLVELDHLRLFSDLLVDHGEAPGQLHPVLQRDTAGLVQAPHAIKHPQRLPAGGVDGHLPYPLVDVIGEPPHGLTPVVGVVLDALFVDDDRGAELHQDAAAKVALVVEGQSKRHDAKGQVRVLLLEAEGEAGGPGLEAG